MAVVVDKHGEYNFSEYNANEYNDNTLYATMDLEGLSVAVAGGGINDILAMLRAEGITLSDAVSNSTISIRTFSEFLLLVDTRTASINDKLLIDSLLLQDWLRMYKAPAADVWPTS